MFRKQHPTPTKQHGNKCGSTPAIPAMSKWEPRCPPCWTAPRLTNITTKIQDGVREAQVKNSDFHPHQAVRRHLFSSPAPVCWRRTPAEPGLRYPPGNNMDFTTISGVNPGSIRSLEFHIHLAEATASFLLFLEMYQKK